MTMVQTIVKSALTNAQIAQVMLPTAFLATFITQTDKILRLIVYVWTVSTMSRMKLVHSAHFLVLPV